MGSGFRIQDFGLRLAPLRGLTVTRHKQAQTQSASRVSLGSMLIDTVHSLLAWRTGVALVKHTTGTSSHNGLCMRYDGTPGDRRICTECHRYEPNMLVGQVSIGNFDETQLSLATCCVSSRHTTQARGMPRGKNVDHSITTLSRFLQTQAGLHPEKQHGHSRRNQSNQAKTDEESNSRARTKQMQCDGCGHPPLVPLVLQSVVKSAATAAISPTKVASQHQDTHTCHHTRGRPEHDAQVQSPPKLHSKAAVASQVQTNFQPPYVKRCT